MRLTTDTYQTLTSVSEAEWELLFPEGPDSYRLIQLAEASGFKGFALASVVVRLDQKPILLLPLFLTQYSISDALPGIARKIAARLTPVFPALLRCRMLGVGFVEGDWAAIGYDRSLSLTEIAEAWKLALSALAEFGRIHRADMTTFVDLSERGGEIVPLSSLAGFTAVPGRPCCQVNLPYKTIEEYFGSLSKVRRKNLKRKLKESESIQIKRTRDVSSLQDDLYALYRQTVSRSPTVFGVHNPKFFAEVCSRVDGAEYVLYRIAGKLVAFNLVVQERSTLIDKYFCMDAGLAREHNLYFISWVENIRYCIEHGIPTYLAGTASEDLKHSLGATLVPSEIIFKHRSALINAGYRLFSGAIAYAPAVPVPRAVLGRRLLDCQIEQARSSDLAAESAKQVQGNV